MDRSATLLPITRALGLAGTGLAAGFMSSIPLWIFPAIFTVPTLSARDRLHLWSHTFDAGKATMVTLIPLSTVSLVLSTYFASPALSASFIARNRPAVFALAAFLTLANFPFTAAFILPRVYKLKKIEKDLLKGDGDITGKAELAADTDPLLMEWLGLHAVRVAMGLAAFSVAIAEAVTV